MKYTICSIKSCSGGFGEFERALRYENETVKTFTGGKKSLAKALSDEQYGGRITPDMISELGVDEVENNILGKIHNEPDRVFLIHSLQGAYYVGADKKA